MRLISWKKVKSWKCITCGECCNCFNIPLKSIEYARMIKIFGNEIFDLNKNPVKIFLKRRENRRCIFQYYLCGKWICAIQQIKPIACKIFPFSISKSSNKKALYKYKGTLYNIYLERSCKGIKLGNPSNEFIYQILPKAIELSLNPENLHNILTSQLLLDPLNQYFLRSYRIKKNLTFLKLIIG